MDRVIDLDAAARVVVAMRPVWADGRLRFGPRLWRDEADEFAERPLHADRSLVADPFSMRVDIVGTDGEQVAGLVLFRGGWADVWFRADGRIEDVSLDVVTLPAFQDLLMTVAKVVAGSKARS
jgi:hypothetical protein